MFANKYIEKNKVFPDFISEEPETNLGIIVVIPAYNEPDIISSIEALLCCTKTNCSIEVIVVINHPEKANDEIIERNEKNYELVSNWAKMHSKSNLKFFVSKPIALPQKDAGVGFARKTGMDEAVSRFNRSNNSKGIILCFDADSDCQENYLEEIENYFLSNPKKDACSIHFEHPLDGSAFPEIIYKRITEYELYLRYFIQAQKYAQLPYAFQTIGSSMAVRAGVYCAQGGMNRKHAGEDFYFLQKIIPHGHFGELTTTSVYPSPRPSMRVPFGTGATITKLIENENNTYEVYNLQAFIDLKQLAAMVPAFFKNNNIQDYLFQLSEPLQQYLHSINVEEALLEINANSSNNESFKKRFFLWFNAFRTLKYLNFSHEKYYKKAEICSQSRNLLYLQNIALPATIDAKNLLLLYRKIDKMQIK